MRVLITGIAGFAGSYLAGYLVGLGNLEIHGVIHRHTERIHYLQDQLHLHRGDLRNALWTDELIRHVQPDYLLHLAAWSDVGGSWQQPWTTYELNIQCQLNLLESIRRYRSECRTLIVTSNEVYGFIAPEDLPLDEETPFRPGNPYAVSKIAQDMMALQYWLSHHIPTLRVRSFNHIGPGQSDDFAASAFAKQIAEIETGSRDPVVYVGNLEARRDFSDVRDIVVAYWLLATKGAPGAAYNIGSGRSHSIHWVLNTLLALAETDVQVVIDPQRLRPSDIPDSFCDNSKVLATTDWQPRFTLHDSLHDVLNYWRQQMRKNRVDNIGSYRSINSCQRHSLPA